MKKKYFNRQGQYDEETIFVVYWFRLIYPFLKNMKPIYRYLLVAVLTLLILIIWQI